MQKNIIYKMKISKFNENNNNVYCYCEMRQNGSIDQSKIFNNEKDMY